jgi:hypothetical protein
MTERWDRHFLNIVLNCAIMSKDPSTKLAAKDRGGWVQVWKEQRV